MQKQKQKQVQNKKQIHENNALANQPDTPSLGASVGSIGRSMRIFFVRWRQIHWNNVRRSWNVTSSHNSCETVIEYLSSRMQNGPRSGGEWMLFHWIVHEHRMPINSPGFDPWRVRSRTMCSWHSSLAFASNIFPTSARWKTNQTAFWNTRHELEQHILEFELELFSFYKKMYEKR